MNTRTRSSLEGPFGWVILHVAKVTPAVERTFDQMQDQIRADLIKARAGARITGSCTIEGTKEAGGGRLGSMRSRWRHSFGGRVF